MKAIKVTKKNVERLAKELEQQLVEKLTPYITYGVSNDGICGGYARINVVSTDAHPYITSVAMGVVIDVFENSRIKASMFYGICDCERPSTKDKVPCISINIKIVER